MCFVRSRRSSPPTDRSAFGWTFWRRQTLRPFFCGDIGQTKKISPDLGLVVQNLAGEFEADLLDKETFEDAFDVLHAEGLHQETISSFGGILVIGFVD